MKRIIFSLMILACLTLMASSAVGQEDEGGSPDNLLDALLLIPNIPEARLWVSYVDYRGVEMARPGAQRPDSLQEFLDGDDSLGVALWWSAFMGIYNGPGSIHSAFQLMGDLPETVGMDFMEVEQAIEWGQPPQLGTVFLGDFDEDAIAAAYTSRDYSASELNGLTLWCNDDVGCEGGTQTDIQGRRPEIPFGGHLGQRQPMLVLDGGILSSSQFALIEATSQIPSRDVRSLGETPEYRTIVEVLDDSLVTIQALILPSEEIAASSTALFMALPAESRAAFYDELIETSLAEPIPAYELFAVVDQASTLSQVVEVMLVYSSVEDAEAAAEVIPERINDYESLRTRQPLTQMLEDRDASFATFVYTSEETGKAVLMITFTAPLAASLPIDGQFERSSLLNRLFIDMIYSRDTAWLSTELLTLEEIEAELEGE